MHIHPLLISHMNRAHLARACGVLLRNFCLSYSPQLKTRRFLYRISRALGGQRLFFYHISPSTKNALDSSNYRLSARSTTSCKSKIQTRAGRHVRRTQNTVPKMRCDEHPKILFLQHSFKQHSVKNAGLNCT